VVRLADCGLPIAVIHDSRETRPEAIFRTDHCYQASSSSSCIISTMTMSLGTIHPLPHPHTPKQNGPNSPPTSKTYVLTKPRDNIPHRQRPIGRLPRWHYRRQRSSPPRRLRRRLRPSGCPTRAGTRPPSWPRQRTATPSRPRSRSTNSNSNSNSNNTTNPALGRELKRPRGARGAGDRRCARKCTICGYCAGSTTRGGRTFACACARYGKRW